MARIKLLFVFGTRPEAVKLAPVILKAKGDRRFAVKVCVTAQHRSMLDQVLGAFGIRPDIDLDIMGANQPLTHITSSVLDGMTGVFKSYKPDMTIVQGDTTSTFSASLASYYSMIPVAHVEAGLRTFDKYSPYPEEINRVLTGHIADLHFAPTKQAKENLIKEGIGRKSIHVTGNTVIDALNIMREKIAGGRVHKYGRQVLVTAHRRESFGEGFRNICRALRELARRNPSLEIIYPVHLNPNVKGPVHSMLSGLDNVHLIEPLQYEPFVKLMMDSYIILTDSGGIQEEAASIGKPVLVMRQVTERMEAVEAGAAMLVGTDPKKIVQAVEGLLNDKRLYASMSRKRNIFGDGRASERIMEAIAGFLFSNR